MIVSIENKANEEKMHASSSGATISTNLLKSGAVTLEMNYGVTNSYNQYLNEGYIRGAVDFKKSEVRNKGCLVMDIENAGASYQYVPASEVHKSRNFAICLSGLDLSSPDAFAYSLGRSLASSATSAGIGMLASEAGLGGFVSSIAASLAGTYVGTEVFPQSGDNTIGLRTNSNISFEHNGTGFHGINVEFDKNELNSVITKIKENIFNEALDQNLSIAQTVKNIDEGTKKFAKEVNEGKARVNETAERIENNENNLRDEVKSEIGEEEILKLAEGQSISEENKAKVVKSLAKSIKQLEKQRAELNLQSLVGQKEVQEAALQAQNELIEEKIHQYKTLGEFLNRPDSVGLKRSSSLDDLLEDTYIRQGQMAFGTMAEAFSGLAHEANTLSRHDYVELQRTRLPEEAKNNPEVLAKLSTGYMLYKGVAKVGEGISALDDATGNVVSGAMNKIGEGFEWLGTHTRRYVRDDLGFSQRVAQNTGDVAKLTAEIFAPGAIAKGVNMTGKTISAIRTTLQARFSRNIYARFNQVPYNPRAMESILQAKYGDSTIISSTMPKSNAKNVRLAGTRHPETGIVFNKRGMPIFDDVAKVEVRISGKLSEMKPEAHKVAATRQLKADIEAGKIDRRLFSDLEWKQIEAGKPKIGDYTWHHHENTGRMQLIPEELHKQTGHLGGNSLWGMEKK